MLFEMRQHIQEAERKINHILSDLEKRTDAVVESINLDKIDITQIQDTRPKFKTTVRIETCRIPGNDWNI